MPRQTASPTTPSLLLPEKWAIPLSWIWPSEQHHDRGISSGRLPSASGLPSHQEGEHRPYRGNGSCDPSGPSEKGDGASEGLHPEQEDIRSNADIEKHADWVDEFLPNYTDINEENIDDILKKEVEKSSSGFWRMPVFINVHRKEEKPSADSLRLCKEKRKNLERIANIS